MARLLSRDEAALLLDVTPQTISNWVEKGVLKGHFVDRLLKIDKATIEKYFDTLSDLAFIEKRIFAAKRDLQLAEKELEKNLDDTRSATHLLGKGVPTHLLNEIFSAIIEASGDDVLKEREKTILTMLLEGKDVEFVAEEYGLTRSRIMQIVNRAFNKICTMQKWPDAHRDYKRLLQENRNLSVLTSNQQAYIKQLEQQLNINNDGDGGDSVITGYSKRELADVLSRQLRKENLSLRTLNCLRWVDIVTVNDLIQVTACDLLKIRNFGKKSLREVNAFLDRLNLSLGTNVSDLVDAQVEYFLKTYK